MARLNEGTPSKGEETKAPVIVDPNVKVRASAPVENRSETPSTAQRT
jgi:hypothetical protein